MSIPIPFEQRLRLRFPIYGDVVPLDHAEPLYAAVSTLCPDLHQTEGISLSPIQGETGLHDTLYLNRGAHLYVQVEQDLVAKVMRLAGKTLRLKTDNIRLGTPSLTMIAPSFHVFSRFVTIKNATDEVGIRHKVRERLINLGIDECDIKVQRRRVITIHNKKVVGFGVGLSRLSEEDSIAVQVLSVGGRRRYGAGFFMPGVEADR